MISISWLFEQKETTDYKGYIITTVETKRGWSGNAKKDDNTLTIRGSCPTKEEWLDTIKNMVDNYSRNEVTIDD